MVGVPLPPVPRRQEVLAGPGLPVGGDPADLQAVGLAAVVELHREPGAVAGADLYGNLSL